MLVVCGFWQSFVNRRELPLDTAQRLQSREDLLSLNLGNLPRLHVRPHMIGFERRNYGFEASFFKADGAEGQLITIQPGDFQIEVAVWSTLVDVAYKYIALC